MTDKPPPRRPAFEEITAGWGCDSFDDLMARCQLLAEWWQDNFPMSMAENKVATAMTRRLRVLGGLPPPELPN